MRAVFTIGGDRDRSGEILDLTAAPAADKDGIVARWLREALTRDSKADQDRRERPAV